MRIEFRYEDVPYKHEKLLTDAINYITKKGRRNKKRLVSVIQTDRGITNLIFEKQVKVYSKYEWALKHIDKKSEEWKKFFEKNRYHGGIMSPIPIDTLEKLFVMEQLKGKS
jgi:hypothetical protein